MLKKQANVEACAISSWDEEANEVDSRFVNLKYIVNNKWIFFTNYQSPKSTQFHTHNQISALFYWSAINVQIRLKGKIEKSSKSFSDRHFQDRSKTKNALAISSKQSKPISSYSQIVESYENSLENFTNRRPNYWGGFEFEPYSYEFWQGSKFRLNKRESYINDKNNWKYSILQP